MKKKLIALLATKNERKAAICNESDASNNVEELRKLSKELDSLNGEIRSLQEMIDATPDEANPSDPDQRTAAVNGKIPGVVEAAAKKPEQRKAVDDLEYRKAFMDYCKTGKMAAEYRLDAFTDVAEAAALIPTTIMSEIVKKMTSYGSLFAKVRKLNIKGGVNFPILSLKPTASWITEAAPSDRKKITANTSVSFSYFGLEVKIATSLLADTSSIDIFEASMSDLVSEAMLTALDKAIMNGAGTTEPVGIAVDTRVPAAQIVTLSSAEVLDYSAWKKKVIGKIPVAYRARGSWVMAAGTFEGYIDGMLDANGQPVGRVNYGIADGPQERFNGKEVMLVEDDVVEPYDTASVGEVIAVFCNLQDYVINSNLQMQVYRWLDQDKNQWVDKAILIADGKLVDPNGVVIVKKGA
jgi:HK97 family phage major capsid protein